MPGVGIVSPSVRSAPPGRLTRVGGILVFLGFVAFGGMFATFGIQDLNVFELAGGAGWILAALGALFITLDLTRTPPP